MNRTVVGLGLLLALIGLAAWALLAAFATSDRQRVPEHAGAAEALPATAVLRAPNSVQHSVTRTALETATPTTEPASSLDDEASTAATEGRLHGSIESTCELTDGRLVARASGRPDAPARIAEIEASNSFDFGVLPFGDYEVSLAGARADLTSSVLHHDGREAELAVFRRRVLMRWLGDSEYDTVEWKASSLHDDRAGETHGVLHVGPGLGECEFRTCFGGDIEIAVESDGSISRLSIEAGSGDDVLVYMPLESSDATGRLLVRLVFPDGASGAGVRVRVLDGAGSVIDYAFVKPSNQSGDVAFDQLLPGKYIVAIAPMPHSSLVAAAHEVEVVAMTESVAELTLVEGGRVEVDLASIAFVGSAEVVLTSKDGAETFRLSPVSVSEDGSVHVGSGFEAGATTGAGISDGALAPGSYRARLTAGDTSREMDVEILRGDNVLRFH